MGIWRSLSFITIFLGLTQAGLIDIIKRSRRNFVDPDDVLAVQYWHAPVSMGVYINNDYNGDIGGGEPATKRADTPLHPVGSGSGSGSGSNVFYQDSAKRDQVPKPKKHMTAKAVKKDKFEAEKKSELTAEAAKVEVQGEKESKRQTSLTCQGQKEWFQCPTYHLIKINNAFWGRDDKNSCSRSSLTHGLKTHKMCAQDESNTMVKVQNACDGESACELVASQVYFDRTDCPDVYKYLRVDWECAHSESRIKDTIESEKHDTSAAVERTNDNKDHPETSK